MSTIAATQMLAAVVIVPALARQTRNYPNR